MSTIASAYIQLLPSAKGIGGSISKALKGEASSAGTSAGESLGSNLVNKLKGIIAAAGIGKALVSTISQGAELEQNLGGTEAVFGGFAKNIQASAQDAYKNMGLSASDYMATANKMGSLFQGSGIEQKKSLDLTAAAMQRAADVASVMGLDTSMAMESIAGAAKGNFTMMDNLGVAMNATTLQAYALEKGINFKWNTASNAEKAELAMKMFMERTSQYEGNFAKESEGTLSGALGAMKAAAQDFAGNLSLGENVTPSLENLVETVITFAKNLIPAITNVLTGLPTAIANVFSAHGSEWMQQGLTLIQNIGDGLKSGIPEFLANALPMVVNFSGKLREGAGQLISSGMELIKSIAQGIANSLPTIIENFPAIISNIAGIINDNLPKLLATGAEVIVTLGKGIISAIPALISNFPQIAQAAYDVFTAFNWLSLGSNVVTAIKNGLSAAKTTIPEIIKSAGSKAVEAFKSANWASVGKTAIGLLASAVKGAANLVVDGLKAIGNNAINAFKSIDWKGVGKTVIDFLKGAITSAGAGIKTVLQTIGKNAIEAFKNTDWKGVGKKVIEALANAAKGAMKLVGTALKEIGKYGIEQFKNINWLDLGKDIVKGIASGIGKGVKFLTDAIGNLGKSAVEAAKKKLRIGSPSKVFADEVGQWIPKGIEEGIRNNTEYAKKSADDMSKAILDAAKNWLDEYKLTRELSLQDEAYYWQQIAAQTQQGSEAWITAMQNMKKAEEDMTKEHEQAVESIRGQVNLFDEVEKKSEISSQGILKNMHAQISALKSWASNLKELAKKGIDEGLLKHLADMGPQGAQYVAAFAGMTKQELKRASKDWNVYLKLTDQTATDIQSSWKNAGKKVVDSFNKGVESGDVKQSGKNLVKNIKEPIETGLETHSPSKYMVRIGQNVIQGLAIGLKNTDGLKGGITTLTNAILGGFKELPNKITSKLGSLKTIFSAGSFKSIGQNIVNGIILGVESKSSALVAALQKLASKALKAAKKKLKIKSPSKVFADQVGQWIPAGIAEGIESNMSMVGDSLSGITNMAARTALPTIGLSTESGNSNGATASTNAVTINVYGAQGQDVNDLAQKVADKINNLVYQQRAVFA